MSRKVTMQEIELEYNFANRVVQRVLSDFTYENLKRCNEYLNVEVNGCHLSEFNKEDFKEFSLTDGSVEMIRVETAHVYLYVFYDNGYEFNKSSVLLSDVYGNDLPDDGGLDVVNEEYLSEYFTDKNDEMELDKYYSHLEKLYKEF